MKPLRVTRLDAEGNPTGETIEVSTVDGASVEAEEPGEWFIPEGLRVPETYTMECVFKVPNPDLLGLMTGWVAPSRATFAIEIRQQIPVRRRAWRVVWEWLTRQPRQYTEYHTLIPNARVVSGNDEIGD